MEALRRRPVLNKADMMERWRAGEFGNSVMCWPSVRAFLDDTAWPADRKVAVRYLKPGAPFCAYDLLPCEVVPTCNRWVRERGADPALFWVNDSSNPDDKLILQGEALRGARGLELRYSTYKAKMRDALRAAEQNAHGLTAKLILDRALDAVSREWLDELLDRYEDHVVEFSTWSVSFGVLGWNTVFWEVRSY